MEARHGVYVLVNSETHGIVKIGETTRHVNDRIPELHQTGTIGRFKCVGFIKTDGQPALLERKLHGYFREQHVNNEYFRVSPETVIKAALKLMGANDNVVISPIDVAKEQAKQQAEAYERAGREAHAKRKEELAARKESEKYNRTQERKTQGTKDNISGVIAGVCAIVYMFGLLTWVASTAAIGSVVFGSFISTMIFLGVWGGSTWLIFNVVYKVLGGTE